MTAPVRHLRVDDLADLAVPSQPALSPDGNQVVYVLRTLDLETDRNVDELWLVTADGSAPARRFTHGPADSAPAWSSDGDRVSFLRDGQVAVLSVSGGDAERLAFGFEHRPLFDMHLDIGGGVLRPVGGCRDVLGHLAIGTKRCAQRHALGVGSRQRLALEHACAGR